MSGTTIFMWILAMLSHIPSISCIAEEGELDDWMMNAASSISS